MTDEATSYTRDDLDKLGGKWDNRLKAAEKREGKWIKAAQAAEEAYLCDEDGDEAVPSFNILHSNVETIVPAVYNSTPAPDVRPRHNKTDKVAKAFSDALERAIAAQIDDDRLNVEIELTAQDVEVAGRGITRIKLDFDDDGNGGIVNERVVYENVSWRDYREGPATRWSGVPWVAYRHEISTEEMERLSDDEIAGQYDDDDDPEEELDVSLWEIWCKETKKVYYLIEDKARIVGIKDDPLQLDGFFPQPDAIHPIHGTGKRTPVCPYSVYRRLADELDMATRRINSIMAGLKVRGLIAGDAEVVELLAAAGDNDLVPAPSLMGIMASGKLDDMITWWPLDTAIAVLAQLYTQREATKQAIYEITGISDIVRGASDARETAAAQQIKTQWGSQRVKRRQRMIQSHVRDLFVLTAEVISKLFTPQGFAKASGVEVTPEIQAMLGQLDNWRIDVESDSTVRADLERQRGEMSQFLEATGGFFSVMAPLVGQKPELAQGVAEIYAAFTRTFQLGKQAEDAIDQMTQVATQAAENPQPNPAVEAQKAEMALKQAELQVKQGDQQIKQVEVQVKGQEAQARIMASQASQQREQQAMQLAARKAQMDEAIARFDMALKAQDLGLRVDAQQLEATRNEIDAMLRIEEMKIERTQKRPVAIGD